MKEPRILIVDDEPRYIKLLRYNLESVGYQVAVAEDGEGALLSVASQPPDLVILDIRLPDMDGFEVCRRLREFSSVPVIMLTAKGEEQDKIRGLQLGADDYVTKPFSAPELLARVEAVLRRSRLAELPTTQPAFTHGDLVINFSTCQVMLQGKEVHLTPTEYRLLHCLAINAGKVVTHEDLLTQVWGPEYREEFEGLRMFISRLRHKIEEDPQQPGYILNRPGIGYFMTLPG